MSLTISQLSGLREISCRINDQRSDGKQEEHWGLNTLSLWGGAAHLHTLKGNTWGTINNDALPGADETYARTLPKHKLHSITND